MRQAEFHDGVIRSAARMTYQQVQAIVDGDAELRGRYAPLVELFQRMDELAKLMRKRRYERGSLDFDLPEPKLVLDAAGEMTGIVAHERLDSMRVIEEFMLAANEAVAERLSSAGVRALYPHPRAARPRAGRGVRDLVASLGYRVPAQPGADAAGGLPAHPAPDRGQAGGEARLLPAAAHHEAGALPRGEPRPLRPGHRDVRALHEPDPPLSRPGGPPRAARAARGEATDGKVQRARWPEMGRHLSEMERSATDAERELTEWKKVRFMADKLGEVYTGYVTGVQSFGLFVELDEIYVQGLVHVSSMTDDYYQFDEKAHTLKGENTGQGLPPRRPVEVQVVRVDLERRKIDFALVDVLERAPPGERPAQRSRGGRPAGPWPPTARRPAREGGRTQGGRKSTRAADASDARDRGPPFR